MTREIGRLAGGVQPLPFADVLGAELPLPLAAEHSPEGKLGERPIVGDDGGALDEAGEASE